MTLLWPGEGCSIWLRWCIPAGVSLTEEAHMVPSTGSSSATIGPRKKPYDEGVDEPPKLIEKEPVDIEREAPAEDDQSVEQIEDSKKPNSPAFEE
jgi:hypothetical protein